MTLDEERRVLAAAFDVCDHIEVLHLTGGGEPLLHVQLAEMIEIAMEYSSRFDKLMLFTNCTIPLNPELSDMLKRHKEKLFIQLSQYGIKPEREKEFTRAIEVAGISHRIRKYYNEDQSFGGWVSFGGWDKQDKSTDELEKRFAGCGVTQDLRGNWRTRDGKVHWCSRSQRGMELGLVPDDAGDYVDLFDDTAISVKREKFERISKKGYITACDYCSGDQGTLNTMLRVLAAEQIA